MCAVLPDTPCELCGDAVPLLHLQQDPDHGWDALCAACFLLQQPPAPAPLWPCLPQRPGLGRPRPQAEADVDDDEVAW